MRLEEYLKTFKKTAQHFANEIGVEGNTIRNLVKGKMPRYDMALLIEDSTLGAVTYRELSPKELPKRKRRANRRAPDGLEKPSVEHSNGSHDHTPEKPINDHP